MGYIDKDGNLIEDKSFQDKFLGFMFSHKPGRFVMKFLTIPIISRLGGRLLDSSISRHIVPSFEKYHKMNMGEYLPKKYLSYNDFFTRSIRPEARPIDQNPNSLISPSDGRVSVYPITEDGIFKIKHANYTVHTLLRDFKLAKRYEGGYCILVRLCVMDYHHYCYVADGVTTYNRRIEGLLHTVNPVATKYFPIYKENTREYCMLRTKEFGDIIQMEVGALMVGKINNLHEQARVHRGEEKGHFEFGGSTVILLVEKNKINILEHYIENTRNGHETLIKQGEVLGYKI